MKINGQETEPWHQGDEGKQMKERSAEYEITQVVWV